MVVKTLSRIVILALASSSMAMASLPADGGVSVQDQQTVSAWTAHLNYYYPQLNVAIQGDMNSSLDRAEVILELQALEDYMQGGQSLADGALKHIACSRPACDGGGDGGKCRTCAVDDSSSGDGGGI